LEGDWKGLEGDFILREMAGWFNSEAASGFRRFWEAFYLNKKKKKKKKKPTTNQILRIALRKNNPPPKSYSVRFQ
jgi:hypothetical protein